uniref:Uncharacterized protein n=1 Tax=Brassica oleracea var. oleracea TaxID=109376 RepID=A0A0D2ZSW3_BRAOL
MAMVRGVTRVHSSRNLSATTAEAMETHFTRIHHHRLTKARLKQCLTEFWKDSNSSL